MPRTTEVRFVFARAVINHDDRNVTTFLESGHSTCATRDDTEANRREARDEGYASGNVWLCLVEHELLHSFIPQVLWTAPSKVIEHEAGAVPHAYRLRLYEESLVLCFQRYLHTREIEAPLEQFAPLLPGWVTDFYDLAWRALCLVAADPPTGAQGERG